MLAGIRKNEMIFLVWHIANFFFVITSNTNQQSDFDGVSPTTRFLIFDVRKEEGFNYRRDCYINAAHIVRYMYMKGEKWILVLPPWNNIKHWKSTFIEQNHLQWNFFFDIQQMNSYVPVMEYKDFITSITQNDDSIFHVRLARQRYKGKEYRKIDCRTYHQYYTKESNKSSDGLHWNMEMVHGKKITCIEMNAPSSISVLGNTLVKFNTRYVYIPVFDSLRNIILTNEDVYETRSSLVFASHLREEADKFRAAYLNSTDATDQTHYESGKRGQRRHGNAIGGPFIGLHMRRGDFHNLYKLPTPAEIATEVNRMLEKFNLGIVYLSSDGNETEIRELQSHVKGKVIQYPRTVDTISRFKDGGIAIIDQWIVSHARYFVGTCASTFSHRVYEEREFLGFSAALNCICHKKGNLHQCQQLIKPYWRINY